MDLDSEWLGPPRDVLPGVVALELLLARSTQAAVAVNGAWAYPTGVGFRLAVLYPAGDPDVEEEIARPGPGHLDLSVRFADGRQTAAHRAGGVPAAPVLMPGGGFGREGRWDLERWLWPLPPPGPLAFHCSWRARGIGPVTVQIGAGTLRSAAARALRL